MMIQTEVYSRYTKNELYIFLYWKHNYNNECGMKELKDKIVQPEYDVNIIGGQTHHNTQIWSLFDNYSKMSQCMVCNFI